MITVGIDEVGRGAWAGPLVVGAVILNPEQLIAGLLDSKLLSKHTRELLAGIINNQARAVGLGFVEPAEVDELGLTAATSLACRRALDQINIAYDEIIIDGSINYLPDEPRARAVIKADSSVPTVSAASIIAKVARDQYMCQLAQEHPLFGFERHVGYGTAAHLTALSNHGITPLHRLSFKPVAAFIT